MFKIDINTAKDANNVLSYILIWLNFNPSRLTCNIIVLTYRCIGTICISLLTNTNNIAFGSNTLFSPFSLVTGEPRVDVSQGSLDRKEYLSCLLFLVIFWVLIKLYTLCAYSNLTLKWPHRAKGHKSKCSNVSNQSSAFSAFKDSKVVLMLLNLKRSKVRLLLYRVKT